MGRAMGAVPLLAAVQAVVASVPAKPPHILFVLVDDLGHADVGFTDGPPSVETVTPTLDALVAQGVRLDRHYVHYTCTPTRSSIHSGRLPVHVTTHLSGPTTPSAGIPRNYTGMAEVLRRAGYATHFMGKWDAGMATPKHTPEGRGYMSSLNYWSHKNDFWTMVSDQSGCAGPDIVDLWQANASAAGVAWHLVGAGYEEYLFRDEALRVLEAHPPSVPLLLFYAAHVGHFPLQVPQEAFEKTQLDPSVGDVTSCSDATGAVWPGFVNGTNVTYSCRRQYHAMVNLLDGVVEKIQTQLVAKGMWNDTLMVFSSDNGGQARWPNAAGANAPLRGGKYAPWEGGVRVAAFVSGGALPPAVRGTRLQGMVHGCDWYATFAALAGEDPTDKLAASSGLPPIDSLNIWPLISGANATSPRTVLPLDGDSIIVGDWKLLLGSVGESGWTGYVYPNASTAAGARIDGDHNCGESGCLFNVAEDVGEHIDRSSEEPSRVAAMTKILATEKASYFANHDRGVDSCPAGWNREPESGSCGCWMARHKYGGAFGPFQEITGVPPGPPAPAPAPPGPPRAGTTLRWAAAPGEPALCLAPKMGLKPALVVLLPSQGTSCTGLAHGWAADPHSGQVSYNGTATCLRPADPPKVPGDCVAGTFVIIGKCPSGVGIRLLGGKLVSEACTAQGLCVLGMADVGAEAGEGAGGGAGSVALGNCSSVHASGWLLRE